MSVAKDILAIASQKQVKITTAESCTGGMIAAALTDLPGSSAIFEHGFVTYSNQAKIDMLAVLPETLTRYGAVSENVTNEMAQGARAKAGADIALSVSGIAGPGGSEHKPEGRVCFCVSTAAKSSTTTIEFGAIGRSAVRTAARDHGLKLILQALNAF